MNAKNLNTTNEDQSQFRLGQWHIEYLRDQMQPQVCDGNGLPVATIHGANDTEILERAILIAKIPSLREATILAYQSFQVMAANNWGRASEVAQQLIPYYETVLHGIPYEPNL